MSRREALVSAGAALVAFAGVAGGTTTALSLIEYIIALLLVLAVAHKPLPWAVGLVLFLPVQTVLLSQLWAWGVPTQVVRGLGGYKELVAVGLVLAAVRNRPRHGRRPPPDTADRWALGYLGLVTLYLLAPLSGLTVLGAQPLSVRLYAWRSDALFAVLFLAVRRVPWPPHAGRVLVRALMVIAAVVAGVAVLEFAATTTWNDYLVRTARVPQYATYVLHSPPLNSNDMINRNVVGGVEIVRIGSTLLSPLTLGFWLLLPFALGLRALTRHVVRPAAVVIAAGTAVALIVTETRAALLGALAATALLLGAAGGSRRGRMRLAVLAGVGAFLLLPVVGATTLSQRASGTVDQTEPSASQHLSTTTSALWALIGSPVGRGLGTAPGVGDRFAVSAKLTSENSYLQVGNELGIWTMIVFIGLLVSVVRKARWIGAVEDSHHADRPPASRAPPEMAAAVAAGGVGLMVAGFFLHVWLDFPVSLTFWLFAGVALPARTAAAAAAPAAALPPAATTARRTAALAPA